MIKTVELIVFIGLLIFSFFLGVRYSNTVRENVSWLQNKSDEELELPNLANEAPEAAFESGPEGNLPPMDQIQSDEIASETMPNKGLDSQKSDALQPTNQAQVPLAPAKQ